jgi:hypothetical protein
MPAVENEPFSRMTTARGARARPSSELQDVNSDKNRTENRAPQIRKDNSSEMRKWPKIGENSAALNAVGTFAVEAEYTDVRRLLSSNKLQPTLLRTNADSFDR